MFKARTTAVALIAAALLTVLATPAHAHGWAFSGAEGGGGGAAEAAPDLGIDLSGINLDGTGVVAPGGSSPVLRLPGSGSAYGQATAGRARSKTKLAPWNKRLRIDWKAAFPVAREGYGAQTSDPSEGLRLHADEGGWERKWQPNILVIWDPSLAHHRKAMASLEADARVRSASHLFNCFRMDSRSLATKSQAITLKVFDRRGKLLGKVSGQKRLHNVYDLLDQAVAKDGRKLSKVTPYLSSLLSGIAYCNHEMDWMSAKVICPDCGHERQDVLETLAQMKVRREALKLALGKVQGL